MTAYFVYKTILSFSASRINHSANTTYGTAPSVTQDTERRGYVRSTSFNSPTIDDEQTPLVLNGSINEPKPIVMSSTSDNEVITFADIPMPGLWEQDEAGKNTDRIIILLFILLASVIVVS